MRFHWYLPILLCCLLPLHSQAALYKWVDENGEVVYSDQPPNDEAKPLDLPPIMVTPAIKVKPAAKKTAAPAPEKKTEYQMLVISRPTDDSVIFDNAGNIPMSFQLQPTLNSKAGDTLEVEMDGKVIMPNLSTTSVTLNNIDRGSHNLKVRVKDKNGQILISSQPITVHLRKFSKLQKKPAPLYKPKP